jgi:hypothetical protein
LGTVWRLGGSLFEQRLQQWVLPCEFFQQRVLLAIRLVEQWLFLPFNRVEQQRLLLSDSFIQQQWILQRVEQ